MDKSYLLKNYCVTEEQFERFAEYKIFDPNEDMTDKVLQKIGLAMMMEKMGFDIASIGRYISLDEERKRNRSRGDVVSKK